MTAKQIALDPKLVKHVKTHPYLLSYITRVAEEVSIPQFYETYELSYDMKKLRSVNLLYPVGEGIYIHVYMPPKGTISGYRKYVAVEPPKPHPNLLRVVELKLAEVITESDVAEEVEEVFEVPVEILKEMLEMYRLTRNVNRAVAVPCEWIYDAVSALGRVGSEFYAWWRRVVPDFAGWWGGCDVELMSCEDMVRVAVACWPNIRQGMFKDEECINEYLDKQGERVIQQCEPAVRRWCGRSWN